MTSFRQLVAHIPGRWINYFAVAGAFYALGAGFAPHCFWGFWGF